MIEIFSEAQADGLHAATMRYPRLYFVSCLLLFARYPGLDVSVVQYE